MPEISRFYGIVIYVHYADHEPPHFHARYQEQEVTVEILTTVVQGKMPGRALRMLFEWSELHRPELLDNWQRAQERRPLVSVPPLL